MSSAALSQVSGVRGLIKKPLSVFRGRKQIFAPPGTVNIPVDDFLILQVNANRSPLEIVGTNADGSRIFALQKIGTVELVFNEINFSLLPEGQIRIEYTETATGEVREILNVPFKQNTRHRSNCKIEVNDLHDRVRLCIGALGGEQHEYLITFGFDAGA